MSSTECQASIGLAYSRGHPILGCTYILRLSGLKRQLSQPTRALELHASSSNFLVEGHWSAECPLASRFQMVKEARGVLIQSSAETLEPNDLTCTPYDMEMGPGLGITSRGARTWTEK